jgi:twitching motility two-component system response regulator PilH
MAIKKVLVVDDSAPDLLNLQKIISDAGYLVTTATSGQEAIKKARAESPDIIFMDIVMDRMDGYQACRELTQDDKTKGIPVVFVTSKTQKADRVWAEMQGGKAFISKPYTRDQILEQISRLP